MYLGKGSELGGAPGPWVKRSKYCDDWCDNKIMQYKTTIGGVINYRSSITRQKL